MVAFIDDHREKFGVEPICRVLPIAPSVYYALKARVHYRERRPARARRDEGLCKHVRHVRNESRQVYGPREGLEADEARGARRRSLHRGAADATPRPARRGAGADVQGDDGLGCVGVAADGRRAIATIVLLLVHPADSSSCEEEEPRMNRGACAVNLGDRPTDS